MLQQFPGMVSDPFPLRFTEIQRVRPEIPLLCLAINVIEIVKTLIGKTALISSEKSTHGIFQRAILGVGDRSEIQGRAEQWVVEKTVLRVELNQDVSKCRSRVFQVG